MLAIKKNQELIKQKMAANAAFNLFSNFSIDNEYMLSAKKEEEIKSAFERLKQETGVTASKEEESKKVLEAFVELYQKVHFYQFNF